MEIKENKNQQNSNTDNTEAVNSQKKQENDVKPEKNSGNINYSELDVDESTGGSAMQDEDDK